MERFNGSQENGKRIRPQIRYRNPASFPEPDWPDRGHHGASFRAFPLVPPVFSILSFMIACSVAMYALSTKANHHTQGSTIWNIAYAFTLTWIVAGIMSNPKHVFDWFDNLSIVPLFQVVMIDLRRDCRSNSALGRLCSVWRAQLPCLLYLPESPRSS
jgi:hypothetical protein